MPFVPLTPEEKEQYKPPCQSTEHNPPTHYFTTEVMKWRCPECGKETIVFPANTFWYNQPSGQWTHCASISSDLGDCIVR